MKKAKPGGTGPGWSTMKGKRRGLLTSCSRQVGTHGHGTTPNDAGRHVDAHIVRGGFSPCYRWLPRGEAEAGGGALPGRASAGRETELTDAPSFVSRWR